MFAKDRKSFEKIFAKIWPIQVGHLLIFDRRQNPHNCNGFGNFNASLSRTKLTSVSSLGIYIWRQCPQGGWEEISVAKKPGRNKVGIPKKIVNFYYFKAIFSHFCPFYVLNIPNFRRYAPFSLWIVNYSLMFGIVVDPNVDPQICPKNREKIRNFGQNTHFSFYKNHVFFSEDQRFLENPKFEPEIILIYEWSQL